jgi:ELWxxDGT repeat protein
VPRHRPSIVLASLLIASTAPLLAARAAAAPPPAFTVEPLYDVEPTGAPWPYPACPIPSCPPFSGAFTYQLTPLGGGAAFTAFDFDHGEEVWFTDGTPEGTGLLADLCPGPCFALPRFLAKLGGELLFVASERGGWRLWATDGLTVRPIGAVLAQPARPATGPIDGWIYFVEGSEVWRSDGAVVEPASDFPDGGLFILFQLFGHGSRAFASREGLFGTTDELWEIRPASQRVLRACTDDDELTDFATLGGAIYFGASCVEGLPDLGPGLFRTDGSPGGAERVATLDLGSPFHLLPAGDALYFVESSDETGNTPAAYRVWRSDGTAAGTAPLTGFELPWVRLQPPLGNRYLLLNGSDHTHTLDLQTGAVLDLPIPSPEGGPIDPSGSFALIGGDTGWWITYGTPATTFQVFTAASIVPGSSRSAAFLGDRAIFSAEHEVQGEELWLLGLPGALEIPTLGPSGAAILALLLGAVALRALRR